MINLTSIHDHVITVLNKELSKDLTYHNTHHTLDVIEQCNSIAKEEGIKDVQILLELNIAAIYHDTGFLRIYNNHEEASCELAREELPHFGIDEKAIENICTLIMATKVPQMPKNHLQKIICDADLDYLGRPDFFEIGDNLRIELIKYNFISNEHDWEERQLDFLQTHHYFTQTSQKKRGPAEREIIQQLLKHKKTATQ